MSPRAHLPSIVRRVGLSAALLAAAATTARADLLVTGSVAYVDREHTFLGWTGQEPLRPVRRAVVDVLDDATGAILATGVTGQDGSFGIQVAGSGSADVLVRTYTLCDSLDPSEISVRADMIGGPLYSVSSAVHLSHPLDTDLDVGQVVAEKILIGNHQGNPFDIFDAAVLAQEYTDTFDIPDVDLPVSAIYPSPTGGTQAGGPSYIYVSSKEGYDDVVVLHEFGHTFDDRFDWIPSVGGSHSFGQSNQDPSLSVNEGFATYFAAAVREFDGAPMPGYYFDGKPGASIGIASVLLRMRLEDRFPYANSTAGEADEVAVGASLWDLHDHAGTDDGFPGDDDLADGSGTFVGGRTGAELIVAGFEAITEPPAAGLYHIVNLFDALFYGVGETNYPAIRDAFELQKIRLFEDDFEPNNEPALATPLVVDADWTPILTLYSSDADPPAPGTGDDDYFRFPVQAGRIYQVRTRYPNGANDAGTYCDPYVAVWDAEGNFLGSDFDSGAGRNASVEVLAVEDGDLVARVQTQTSERPTGSYEIRVRDIGSTNPPQILSFGTDPAVTAIESWFPGNSILGTGFLGTESVTVDGQPAQFWITSPAQLDILTPPVEHLGPVDVTVTTPLGSSTAQLTMVAPDTPVLFATDTFTAGTAVRLRCGAAPGDVGALLVSGSLQPSSFPGLADLGIGAGGSDLSLAVTFATNGAGVFEEDFPYPSLSGPLTVYMQAIVVSPGATTGPWPVTNITTVGFF